MFCPEKSNVLTCCIASVFKCLLEVILLQFATLLQKLHTSKKHAIFAGSLVMKPLTSCIKSVHFRIKSATKIMSATSLYHWHIFGIIDAVAFIPAQASYQCSYHKSETHV